MASNESFAVTKTNVFVQGFEEKVNSKINVWLLIVAGMLA